jgi:RNA polymerase sigma factor (sigma-70 family)
MEKEFLDIVRNNQGIIHKVCNIYCDTEEDRNDLVQEILAQLWRSFPSFRNESKFTTWMYRVALNTAITTFKKQKRQPDRFPLTLYDYQIADDIVTSETEDNLRKLREAVSKLTGIEKYIIVLYFEKKSYEEIAEMTGITQNYVRVKMNRISKKLKILMTTEDE